MKTEGVESSASSETFIEGLNVESLKRPDVLYGLLREARERNLPEIVDLVLDIALRLQRGEGPTEEDVAKIKAAFQKNEAMAANDNEAIDEDVLVSTEVPAGPRMGRSSFSVSSPEIKVESVGNEIIIENNMWEGIDTEIDRWCKEKNITFSQAEKDEMINWMIQHRGPEILAAGNDNSDRENMVMMGIDKKDIHKEAA